MSIKDLARETIAKIRRQQNEATDPSRTHALAEFEQVVNSANITCREIIESARQQKQYVITHGNFGPTGHLGSTFLREINTFIESANKALFIEELYELNAQDNRYSPVFFVTEANHPAREKREVSASIDTLHQRYPDY